MIRLVAETAIPPEDVADMVLAAVLEDRFWIFSHPDLVDVVDQRHASLLDDRR